VQGEAFANSENIIVSQSVSSAAWLIRHEMPDSSAVDVSIGAQEWIYVWHSESASLPLVRAHFERLRTDMVATPYVTAGE